MSSIYQENDVLAPRNGIPQPSGQPTVARAPLGVGVAPGGFSQPAGGFQVKSGTATTPAPPTAPAVPAPAPPGTPGAPPATGAPAPGTTPFQVPYATYLNTVQNQIGSQSSEGGSTFQPISEQQWNAMSNQERYNTISGTTRNLTESFAPDEQTSAAFRQRFGNETWQADASGRPQDMGRLIYGYGDLRMGANNDDPSQFAIDPSRIMYLPDGRWVMEASNIKGQWLAQQQATDDRIGNQMAARTAGALALGATGALAFEGAIPAATATPAVTADSLTPLINDALLQPLATGGIPAAGSPALVDLPAITSAESLGLGATAAAPALGATPAGVTPATIPPDIPLSTPPPGSPPLATPPPIVQAPTGAWDPSSLLTPGNVARAGLTVAGLAGQHGAKPTTGTPAGTPANPAANPALNDQTTQDLLNRGKPTPDQMQLIKDSIAQQRKTAREQIIQASYNAGQGSEGSMLAQDKLAKLDQDLALLEQTMIQKQASENVRNALSELGALSNAQISLAQMALAEDKAAQERAAAIMQSIMYLWANI